MHKLHAAANAKRQNLLLFNLMDIGVHFILSMYWLSAQNEDASILKMQ